MRLLIISVFFAFSLNPFAFAQNAENKIISNLIDLGSVADGNEDYSNFAGLKTILKDADIVMLGEQSHGDATTFQSKVKLIKYLHQEMGFDILAFESGFYDCQKAWVAIQNDEDVSLALANSVFFLWSTLKEFRPLTKYIDEKKHKERPLILSGFDNQWTGKLSTNHYLNDLKDYLQELDESLINTKEWAHLDTLLTRLGKYDVKKYGEEEAIKDTTYLNTLIETIQLHRNDSLAQFWIQSLKSTRYYVSDAILETNFRDKQMAENLIWLREHNPGKKIVCWGATSHFLYNSAAIEMLRFPYTVVDNYYQKQPMMGQYIKEKYGSRVYTIGFIAYEGKFGLSSNKKIKPPKKNSLEFEIGESDCDNCFLDLRQINTNQLLSRPLAHAYMKNDISQVMDGVIFNRYMTRPHMDRNLFLKIYPENKYIKPETTDDQ
jgi:erythromycin esterase